VRARAAAVAALALLAALSVTTPGAAAAPPAGDVYELSAAREIPILAVSVAGLAASQLFWDGPGREPCPCDASGINGLDRSTAGRRDDGAATASNVVAALAVSAPFALDYFDIRSGGSAEGFDRDAVVMLEALALSGGVDQLVKAATHRPRPLLYGLEPGDPALDETDNYRSFYSSHTASTFAVGIAYARTYALRHPDSDARWAVYGGAALVGAVVGALRVASGRHFPTDVLVGAAAGTAVGLLVPALHGPRPLGEDPISYAPIGLGLRITIPLR
jgi:membrane-associated phospholipid phosphatase